MLHIERGVRRVTCMKCLGLISEKLLLVHALYITRLMRIVRSVGHLYSG